MPARRDTIVRRVNANVPQVLNLRDILIASAARGPFPTYSTTASPRWRPRDADSEQNYPDRKLSSVFLAMRNDLPTFFALISPDLIIWLISSSETFK